MSLGVVSTTPVVSSGFRWWRWFWMTPTLLFVMWAAGAIAFAEWDSGHAFAIVSCVLIALCAGFLAAGLLALGFAAAHQSDCLRADEHGIRHCLLPLIPWSAVLGIDTRTYHVKGTQLSSGEYRFALVICCKRSFVESLRTRWIWDLLNWVGPRYDVNVGVIDIKLDFMIAESTDLVAVVKQLAIRWKAPLVGTWSFGESIEVAIAREDGMAKLREMDLTFQNHFQSLNAIASRGSRNSGIPD